MREEVIYQQLSIYESKNKLLLKKYGIFLVRVLNENKFIFEIYQNKIVEYQRIYVFKSLKGYIKIR